MAAEYRSLPDVEAAEIEVVGGVTNSYPNDRDFPLQWNMFNPGNPPAVEGADIDAPNAWKIHTGDLGSVTIAIVDSGVDAHPEFAGRLVPGINTNNLDRPDLTTTECDDPLNCPVQTVHGTHVAGIAAAQGNNMIGVAGVTWGAYIMPVRVVSSEGTSSSHQAGNGIIWAVDHGADVINVSLQYYIEGSLLRGAVEYAREEGVLVVAAAGNNHGMIVAFPGVYDSVICVSATNKQDLFAIEYSNYGPQVDLSAPGSMIWSTWRYVPGGLSYGQSSGTSMSTPHVAGAAALLKSFRPNLSMGSIRRILLESADDLGDTGWDQFFGHGRLNLYQAMLAADSPLAIAESSPRDMSIDARQPTEPDGSNPRGWQEVELTFSNEAYQEPISAFTVTTIGGELDPPTIEEIVPITRERIRLVFNRPIEVGAWTVVTHKESSTTVQLGFLPGDVDESTITDTEDVMALVAYLEEGTGDEALFSVDVNNSLSVDAFDLMREIELLIGSLDYSDFLGDSLPES